MPSGKGRHQRSVQRDRLRERHVIADAAERLAVEVTAERRA
jgi:hypothetical protein